jgi:Phytanoyl-CoA dioxygenase (PhyH)
VTPSTVPSPVVSAARIREFWRDGFAVLEGLTTREDLEQVSGIMGRLYERYPGLVQSRHARDLGAGLAGGVPEILEINHTAELEPELATTLTFRRCEQLAEALLGCSVEHRFDHAIYKPAFNGRATAWHQDGAYSEDPTLLAVHFWVPIQDVTVEMGCMQFIPGSHREPIRPHHRRERLPHVHALEADDVDTSRAVACPLRAGDATVHFWRTLHYTGANLTPVPRLAWSLEFGPRRGLPQRLATKGRLFWRSLARIRRRSDD